MSTNADIRSVGPLQPEIIGLPTSRFVDLCKGIEFRNPRWIWCLR